MSTTFEKILKYLRFKGIADREIYLSDIILAMPDSRRYFLCVDASTHIVSRKNAGTGQQIPFWDLDIEVLSEQPAYIIEQIGVLLDLI